MSKLYCIIRQYIFVSIEYMLMLMRHLLLPRALKWKESRTDAFMRGIRGIKGNVEDWEHTCCRRCRWRDLWSSCRTPPCRRTRARLPARTWRAQGYRPACHGARGRESKRRSTRSGSSRSGGPLQTSKNTHCKLDLSLESINWQKQVIFTKKPAKEINFFHEGLSSTI